MSANSNSTKLNGTLISALGTGILKNTTGTGIPSIAIPADFPILNQSTTGNAATVTTNANLIGVVTSTGNTTSIANGVITNAMLANAAVENLTGTNTGDNATNTQYSGLVSNATHTGDATGATVLTISNNVVSNAKLAQAPANTIKGNNTNATADELDLTTTEVKSMLAIANTDVSGLGTLSTQNGTFTAIPQANITNLTTDLASKQATLVSGTNIKTINGASLLGATDILLQTPLTISTGLTNTAGIVTVNTTQNINILSNLTTAGFVKTTAGGALSSGLLVSGDIPNNAANTSGTAANITATTNSTITSLPSLALPTTQLTGTITNAQLANGAVANLSGTNTGDNATNTTSNTYADNKVQNSLVASTTLAPSVTAVNTGLATKENTITAGTTAQYWRGDKTFQTLDKTAVGLENVDNTSDANKPVSTAQQTALNLKANIASPTFTGTVGLPAGQVVNGVTLSTASGATTFLNGSGTYTTLAGGGNAIIANGLQQFTGTNDATFSDLATTPSLPAAGLSKIYVKDIGGRAIFSTIDEWGETNHMQSSLTFNNFSGVSPGATTIPTVIGRTCTFLATVSHPVIATTNYKTSINRYTQTSTATAGNVTGTRVAVNECVRGNAANIGGFYFVGRISLTTLQAGNRAFCGLSTLGSTAPTNIDPTTSTTGNWNLVHNAVGTAPTIIPLGTNYPVNNTDFIELILYTPANKTTVYYRVRNLATSLDVSGILSTNLPLNTSPLGRTCWMTNNATAASVALDISKLSLETPN
jgi:hypothetical protein